MTDRLRELIDLVLASLDEPGADGRELAARAHFSRDHLDRLLAAATGESPVTLRRRLLLERAAWQLRVGGAAPSDAAPAAGYGSLAAFSRAFSRAYGVAPRAFAAASAPPLKLDAPNGIHFHPPAGLLIPDATAGSPAGRDLAERLVAHHLDRVRELLRAAATVPADELARPLRPGFVAVWFEGEEPSAAAMAERLVFTLEVWVAAIAGLPAPQPQPAPPAADAPADPAGAPAAGPPTPAPPADPAGLLARFERAARSFARLVRAIRDRGAWDDAFVDALCEPPQSFTYGGVVAHVVEYGAIRREMLASVLTQLGARGLASGDAIEWEASAAAAAARRAAAPRRPAAGRPSAAPRR